MIKFVIGMICGFSLLILYLVLDTYRALDATLTISIVIAVTTILATVIHFDSVRKQRKDRVWEINKDSLLTLSKSLSDAIQMTEKFVEREFNTMQGIPDDTCTDGAREVNYRFEETISDSLNVYKPLMDANLIQAIETYQADVRQIEEMYMADEINNFEAYDIQLGKQKILHSAIGEYIKKAAGINT